MLLGALALGGLGCGGSSGHATDAGKDGTTGAAGADATGAAGADATGAAGADATGAAGSGAAGTGGAGAAGTDGGAGTTGTAGTDGGAGTTGTAGADGGAGAAGGNDGGPDAAAGADGGVSDASDASDVACTNACTLGTKQCGGAGIETCVMGSSTCTVWSAAASCGAHSSCTGVSGSAVCSCNVDPSCASGTATFCASGTSQSKCAADADGCFFVQSTTACPVHESCTGNNPTGACTCDAPPVDCVGGSGATFCATSSTVSTCKTDGNSCVYADTAVGCPTNQACTGSPGVGACTCVADPACTAAGDSCSGNSSVHCVADGNGCFTHTTTACGPHQTCGASGLCACDATTCTTNGPFCSGGNNISTCSTDANSCLFVSATNSTTCTTNATCTGAAGSASCACNTAPSGCTGAGSFCKGSGTQATCTTDGTCPADGLNDHACPANQTCKGAGLGGACSCDDTCTAAQAAGGTGTYCTSATSQQTCTNDPNSCHIASNPIACVGVQTCRGADGAGSCQCPAAGTTAGTGCSTLSATICQGNVVLTCISDVASACLYWAQPVDCTASSLVCGTKAGGGTIAGCQCAEHAGTDYFVDPAAGHDTSALFPTGIDSPAACRFGTLGKGLSLAAAGNRVIATSSAAPPVNFASETFPLVVPASVTLTTADGVLNAPNPADYEIQFGTGGGGSALSLGNSSTFEGFTVVNANGAAAGSAISVASAGAAVDTVDLVGNGLATGISVVGAGQGLFNAVRVEGFTTGISVASTAGPFSFLANSPHVDGNGTGLSISNGTLSAATVTVSGNSASGIVVKAAAGATSALIGSALISTGNTGAGLAQSATGGAVSFSLSTGDIGHNGAGGITLSSGSGTLGAVTVHDNTGSGITQSGATTVGALGSGGTTTVQSNSAAGVTLTGGALTVGPAAITGNTGDGVAASGSATLTSSTGAQYTANGGNGIKGSAATLNFGGSAAAPIIVSGNTGDGVLVTDGAITANYLTLASNGTGATKKSGLEIAGAAAVNIGVATDAALAFTGNGLHGVNINGTTTGSQVDMRRAQITTNGSDGVSVDLNGGTGSGAATASLKSLTTSNNTGHGIEVLRAPLGATTVLIIDALTAKTNGGSGVYLRGNSGNVVATLSNSAIASNAKYGVLIEQAGVNITQEFLQSNDITLNTSGGIAFNTSSTLNGFAANTVHNNGGDQILIAARQNPIATNPPYLFNSAGACDANRNQVWCYSATGVGIRVTGVLPASVTASSMSWKDAVPAVNTDYITSGGVGTFTTSSPCAAQPACP